jgi:N utilization substance protein A
VRQPGALETFNLSPDDAEALIMRARVAMGWIEAEPEPEVEAAVEGDVAAEAAAEEVEQDA